MYPVRTKVTARYEPFLSAVINDKNQDLRLPKINADRDGAHKPTGNMNFLRVFEKVTICDSVGHQNKQFFLTK